MPLHRQLSMNSFSAANVSVFESARDALLLAVARRSSARSRSPAPYWPRTANCVDLLRADRADRLVDLHLLVADADRVQRRRRLHRDQRHELEHVVLHHVAQCAALVVVPAAVADAERLADRDLHVVDVLVVPDRLEDRVGEPHHHQVLHRLLAEVMVDAEDLLLGEVLVQQLVQLAWRWPGRGRRASR